ncbi:MAG: RNase adapter RapZ [Clostridia bacterium]|nr:RNase adapter RapZ [Clostridia bacterium]
MRFLIVTGMSGAGKTSVLRHLEDVGYLCMDNLPPQLLNQAVRLCDKMETEKNIALGVDTRSGAMFDAQAILDVLDQNAEGMVSILFLEADHETLIDRYKETRRDHPLSCAGVTLEQALEKERSLLQPLRERAQYVLSTAGLRTRDLCSRVDEIVLRGQDGPQSLRVEIMSFGFKRGIPRESDLVFDVRFLPNPFYIREIRAYTGLEAPVRDYVMGKEETHAFLSHLYGMIDCLIPLYQREGKRRLMIAIGCTGGAHRSVAISEALGAYLRSAGQTVNVTHRDIALEEASWSFRRTRQENTATE